MTALTDTALPSWKAALTMIINPGLVLKKSLNNISCLFCIGISSLAFALFFLQTGLDLFRTGQADILFITTMTVTGAVYGFAGVASTALLTWVLTKPFGNPLSVKSTVSAFGLSYCSTLIYVVIGLFFSVFLNWKTSVAFGITGVIWAIGPIISTVKSMTRDSLAASIIIATICSGLMLFGWSLLGNL
jgi:hypothetical protein